MPEFDKAVIQCFLEKQLQLFPEAVAETEEEAKEFLEECMAVVLKSKKEVWEYFDEEGVDMEDMNEDDILSADEVFAVGDKSFQEKSKKKTIEMFQSGKTILFSSHSDGLIRQFCKRVIYIKDGKIAFDGPVEEGLAMYNRDLKGNGK